METSRILNWRCWSLIRRAQVIVTVFGFLLTTGFMLYDVLPIEVPRTWLSNQLWGIGMVLEVPSEALARFLGVWETLPAAGFRVLVISVNSTLAFACGTAVGWSIAIIKRAQNRRNQ